MTMLLSKVMTSAWMLLDGGRGQLTLWISWDVVRRQDVGSWDWASTVLRGVRCRGSCNRPAVLLVLGEKEAGSVAESVGWHHLRLALVGEAVIHRIPTLCSFPVVSWRRTGGTMGGHPGARSWTGAGFWCGARGHCGGGRSRGCCTFSFIRGSGSHFFGRMPFFVEWDISNVDG